MEPPLSDATFFAGLTHGEHPKALWIDCLDSHVPAELIMNRSPGDLFVHRCLANLVSPTDDNSMSVLEYAIHVLKVSDVIVCGHYGCAGVRAALLPAQSGLPHIARRISPMRALAGMHSVEFGQYTTDDAQVDRLAELNVISQIRKERWN
jgi:carbonic anhydrase